MSKRWIVVLLVVVSVIALVAILVYLGWDEIDYYMCMKRRECGE
jgi:hypothetical protein